VTFSAQEKAANSIFVGGGEMGKLMRSLDWSQTSLGDVTQWPQSLRSAISILLPSKAQICLFWGSQLITIYNDAYRPAIASKHPWALGRPAHEVLSEVWDVLKPLLEGVITTGEAFWAKDYLFFLNRYGYTEETYFDVSYDPVRDESGEVGGVFCIVSETTGRVLGDRRLQSLSLLTSETAQAKTVEAACRTAMQALATNERDIPFALLYQVEAGGKQATLVEKTGIETPTATPAKVDLTQDDRNGWGLAQVYQTRQAAIVDVANRFGVVPCATAWDKPATAAWVVPLIQAGQDQSAGFLVLGINPYRSFEAEYQRFFELLAGNVATALFNARAFEEERKRVEALAELDRAKTSFFNNISHEFRTPLTLMLSPLEQTLTQLDGIIPEDARSQLQLVQRNGNRLLKLVNTLLDFSRIEAGRTQAKFEPTDLATYTTELASLFQSVATQAGLQLIVDCPPLPEPVYVDRQMWEKIVLNLLSNAFKFTFEGEIAVSLRPVVTASNSCKANQVELVVRDTGTGIPAAEIPRLFERFYRVEGARGRTFEGTGIGLSLVQELVHLHSGELAVESTLGQGSTFSVRLPVGTTHLSEGESLLSENRLTINNAQPSSAESYALEASSWLPQENIGTQRSADTENNQNLSTSSLPARILLVDDNADMRNYLQRILQDYYEVDVVADGETALATAYNHTPDLVLSDVMMPGMDGFELLRQLRIDPRTREIPILLLSARAGEESAVEGLQAGADDYLIKPFSARELLARVATNVELGRSRQLYARRRLDAVVSSIPDFLYTFDLAGRLTYVNQPLLNLWQKSFAEVIGKNFFELDYPTDLAARLQQQIQQVIATRQPLKDETPYTSAFGTRAYEYIFVPLFATDGAVEAVAGTTRDISDRKQAEEALRQSEERFRVLVSASSNVLYRMSPDWSAMHELHGGDFIANTLEPSHDWLQKYIHPDDQARVLEAIGSAIRNKSLFELEHRVRRVDGTVGWTYSRAVPLLDSAGEIIEWFGEATDISDRKRIEAEREQILQREQTARETAERANQIKDEFLAVLSHELRTPLNPILGWTRLLRGGNLDAAKTAYAIETIERNAKLQVQLIEDLLDISRILRGKLSLNAIPINLASVISAALETVQLAAVAKSIHITTNLSPTVSKISGDAGRLQQVVWNLLSNAVKFTPEGG